MTRSGRRAAALLAFLGIAFSALWPLITHARPASQGAPTVVCVAGGMQVVHLDGDGKPQPASHVPREHCTLCLGAIDPVAAAAPAIAVLDISPPPVSGPAPREAPRKFFHPYRPPPRAPPSGPTA